MGLLCFVLWPPLQSSRAVTKKDDFLHRHPAVCRGMKNTENIKVHSQTYLSAVPQPTTKYVSPAFITGCFCSAAVVFWIRHRSLFPRRLEYHEAFLPECSQQRQIFQDHSRSNIIHDEDVTAEPIFTSVKPE